MGGRSLTSSAAKADDGPQALLADPGQLMRTPLSKQSTIAIGSASLQRQRTQRASLTPPCAVVSAPLATATSRTGAHSRSPSPNCPASNRSSLAMTPRPARPQQLVLARQDTMCNTSSHRPVGKHDGSSKSLNGSLSCPITAETSLGTSGGSMLSTTASVSVSWESVDRTDSVSLSTTRLASPLGRTQAMGALLPAQQRIPPFAEVIVRPEPAFGDQPTIIEELSTLPLATPVAASPLRRCVTRIRSKDHRPFSPFESKENWPPPPLLVRSSKGLANMAGCGSIHPVA